MTPEIPVIQIMVHKITVNRHKMVTKQIEMSFWSSKAKNKGFGKRTDF